MNIHSRYTHAAVCRLASKQRNAAAMNVQSFMEKSGLACFIDLASATQQDNLEHMWC